MYTFTLQFLVIVTKLLGQLLERYEPKTNMIFTGRAILHYRTVVPAKRVINVLNNVELFSWYHPRIQDAKLRMDGWYLIREQWLILPVFYLMRLELRQRSNEAYQDCAFEIKAGWLFKIHMRFTLRELHGDTKVCEVIHTRCLLPFGWICRWVIQHNHSMLLRRYEKELARYALRPKGE